MMGTSRLEAFSDGVLAIIITIMVLELKIPHSPDFSELQDRVPIFMGYVLSFIYLGIYWNNHHHLLHVVDRVNSGVLWANLHLLFWLSLLPFATGWTGDTGFSSMPTAYYGFVLLMAGLAFWILQRTLLWQAGKDSILAKALGHGFKGYSMLLYAIAIPIAFWQPWISDVLYVIVALVWLVPDQRIERALREHQAMEQTGSSES